MRLDDLMERMVKLENIDNLRDRIMKVTLE
jgi:hypothetical protein